MTGNLPSLGELAWLALGWVGFFLGSLGAFYGLCILILLLIDDEAGELR